MGVFRQGHTTRKYTSGETTIHDGACLLDAIIINENGADVTLTLKDGSTTKSSTLVLVGDLPRVLKYGDYGMEFTDSIKVTLTGTDGATRHYKFDETTGTNAVDDGTDGSDATLVNGVLHGTGKLGPCVEFDGIDDHVTAGTGFFTSDGSDAFSVSAWIMPVNLGKTQGIALQRHANNDQIEVALLSTNKLSLHMSYHGANHLMVRTTSLVAEDSWTHIVVTYDGSGKGAGVRWYTNGTQRNTTIDMDTLSGVLVISTVNAYIGSYKGVANFFDGKIDELRHYDFELDQADVDWLYNSGDGRDNDFQMADILVMYKE